MKLNEMPKWVCWLAQDSDGTWWGYEAEPNQSHTGRYENEVGDSMRLGVKPLLSDWKETLRRIK